MEKNVTQMENEELLTTFEACLERNSGQTKGVDSFSAWNLEASNLREEIQRRLGFFTVSLPAESLPLPEGVCADRQTDFQSFIDSGDATEEYLTHLDHCDGCQQAIDHETQKTMAAFERLGAYIQAERNNASSNAPKPYASFQNFKRRLLELLKLK
ncbi:MAG: hypothetical protein WCV85_00025 [Patescibacteria group bacterium]